MKVADIRRRKQAERLKGLHQQASLVLAKQPGGSLWLFGSWARGDWDGFSDVDVLAVAPNRGQASACSATLRACSLSCWSKRSTGASLSLG